MYTAEDLRADYPDMNPRAGTCPPIEAVWRMNTMTEAEFREEMAKQRELARASRNLREGERISAEVEALRRECELSGIPQRYLGVPADMRLTDSLKAGRNAWLYGTVGTGKTVEAVRVAKGWASTGGRFRMISTVSLFSELRAAMNGSGREIDVIWRHASIPLLVLDDLGQEVPSDWALSRLFEIVDKRYNATLPTIVTSNWSPTEIPMRLGDKQATDAIMSRLMERCEVKRIAGEDRRIA